MHNTSVADDPDNRPLAGPMYHYTSLEAFLSIVEHGLLRATSLQYLNDASEGVLGISLIRETALRECKHSGGIDRTFLETLVSWLEGPMLLDTGTVYVLCFSEKRDDLSQWRGYTPHGRGMCFGIDVSLLSERMGRQPGGGWTIHNCRYGKQAQQAWANNILKLMRLRAIQNHISGRDPQEHFYSVIGSSMQGLMQTIALIKNDSFSNEKEVRLISPVIRHEDPRVKFRPGKSTIIPFVEFQLAPPSEPLSSVDVHIGPGPTQPLAHAAVSYVMERYPFARAVHYWPSPIPYREV
jgi:hypothetical protein